MALNYNAIEALTRRKHIKELVDNFFMSNPLLMMLRERQQTYDGGHTIVEPLIYGELSGVKSYAGYDTITYDTNIPVTAAEFKPKNLVAPIIISKDEELQNTGESQVLNLLRAKYRIAEETLKKMFTAQLYGDGTGNGGKDLTGLGIAVSNTGTYGGIDRSTYTWWRAYVDSNGGVARELTVPLLVKVFNTIADGDDQPDLIVMGERTWNAYHDLVNGQVSRQTKAVSLMAGLGYQTLEFMGKPVVFDKNIDESNGGVIYMLNTRYLKLRPHKQANFAVTKFRPDDTRIARKQEILWTGNLTCSNCRRQAKIVDIDIDDY